MGINPATRTFLDSQRVARLATVDAGSRPRVVPVCFALDADTLYTVIDDKPKSADLLLRRLTNVAANPHVQILFDAYDDADWSKLRWIQLRGRARIITTGDEHHRALALLRARYPQYRTMTLEARPVIAVTVDRVVEWKGA